MKKTLLTIATLTLLVGSSAFIRAADTNSPSISTNAPAAKMKPYPLDYCLVSGDKIGEMGKPITTNYMGQEIKFCCPDCVKDFRKNPDKYVKQLQDAEKQNKH